MKFQFYVKQQNLLPINFNEEETEIIRSDEQLSKKQFQGFSSIIPDQFSHLKDFYEVIESNNNEEASTNITTANMTNSEQQDPFKESKQQQALEDEYISQLNETINQKDKELLQKKNYITRIEQEIQSIRDENKQILLQKLNDIKIVQEENHQIKEENKSLELQLNNITIISQENNSIKQENKQLQIKLNDIEIIQEENSQIKEENTQLQIKLNNLQMVEQENEQIKEENTQLQIKLNDLEMIQQENKQIKEENQQLQMKFNDNLKLSLESKSLLNTLSQTEKNNQRKDQQIQEMENKIIELENLINNSTEKNEKMATKIEELNLKQLQDQLQKNCLENEIRKLNCEIQQLGNANQEFIQEQQVNSMTNLQSQQQINLEISEQSEKLRLFEETNQQFKVQNQQFKKENQQLKSQLNEQKNKISLPEQNQEEMKELMLTIKKQQTNLDQYVDIVKEGENQLKKKQNELSSFQEENQLLKEQLVQLKDQFNKNTNNKLENKIKQDLLDQILQNYEASKQTISTQTLTINKLKNQVKSKLQQVHLLEKKMIEIQEKYDYTQLENISLQSSLKIFEAQLKQQSNFCKQEIGQLSNRKYHFN